MIYIAIVITDSGMKTLNSKRDNGDWACFLSRNKDKAIAKARTAAKSWGVQYEVLVGTADSLVEESSPYSLKKVK